MWVRLKNLSSAQGDFVVIVLLEGMSWGGGGEGGVARVCYVE